MTLVRHPYGYEGGDLAGRIASLRLRARHGPRLGKGRRLTAEAPPTIRARQHNPPKPSSDDEVDEWSGRLRPPSRW
jgi:hypothetical protein